MNHQVDHHVEALESQNESADRSITTTTLSFLNRSGKRIETRPWDCNLSVKEAIHDSGQNFEEEIEQHDEQIDISPSW